MIPYKIHTCWIDKSSEHIPKDIQKNFDKIRKYYPKYEFNIWTYKSFVNKFGNKEYVDQAYNAGYIGTCIEAMKCYILNSIGGIWIDANIYFNKFFIFPINDFYLPNEFYIIGNSPNSLLFRKTIIKFNDSKFINDDQTINFNSKRILQETMNVSKVSDITKTNIKSCIFRNNSYIDGRGLSIIIPVYNVENIIIEYINHLLSNLNNCKWYDIILVDLYSNDNTFEIIKNIKNNNVVVLDKQYKCKGDALNYAINRSNSDIYFIVDNLNMNLVENIKDIIYDEFMFRQSDILIFNSSIQKDNLQYTDVINYEGSFDFIAISNKIKEKLKYIYEPYYENIENYKLCIHASLNKLNVSLSTLNIVDNIHKLQFIDIKYKNKINKVFFDTGQNSELTAVISFINEKTEVERTISSLRYTANSIKILLVDDCSDDKFDYENISKIYHCQYIRNNKRIGSVGGKHIGGMSVDTPYFCFFDAHMRVYKDNWDLIGVNYLKQYPKSIISSRTTYMEIKHNMIYNEAGYYNGGHNGTSACCKIIMDDGYAFEPKWTDIFIDNNEQNKLSPVSCVLGATYLISKDWWEYIHGFEGLHIYGLEESYISIKTWLLGGACYVVKDWGVGHLYRDINPAPVSGNDIDANRIFLINLFLDGNEKEKCLKELKKRIGINAYESSEKIYKENEKTMNFMKVYIEKNKVQDFYQFFNKINKKLNDF